MDIGAGSGILTVFAVKAGAKKVISIEQSEIFYVMEVIIKNNNCEDKVIMIKNNIKDLKELGENITEVDIIISEWMG